MPDCPHCDRELPNRSALDDHVERAHPDAKAARNWTPIIVGVLVILAVGAVGAALITGGGGGAKSPYHIEQSPRTGSEDAPVKVIAFESPACTSCRLFHIPRDGQPSTFDQVHSAYVDEGQVQYVEKFQRAGYPWGRLGANAQKCAWHQGGWEAFHSLTQGYYENRPRISASNAERFALQWSESSPTVDASAFQACLEERRYDDELTRDLSDGRGAGVAGTPTFIIVAPDGSSQKVVGPQPFSTFAGMIDNALAKAPQDSPADNNSSTSENASEGNGTNETAQADGNSTR